MSTPCQHCGVQHPETLKFCPKTGRLISPERLYPMGTVLEGKYRLQRAIGVGGMGAVFEATHVLLDKRVAIKLLLPEYAGDHEMCQRLIREARAASATGHRNIVAVNDMGYADDGALFVVMEYVIGRTLGQVNREDAPILLPRAVRLVDQVLCALEVVHRKGIVHRDLKPANLLVFIDDVGEETIKILDFGISKITGDHVSSLTTVGKVLGTPRYMSPEQAVGEANVDGRADIYACGVILYELVTGSPPFSASSFSEMIALLLHGEIAPPSRLVAGLPHGFDTVLLKSLARAREQRYHDASAMRRALRPFLVGGAESTCPGLGDQRLRAPEQPVPDDFAMKPVSFVGAEQAELPEPAPTPEQPAPAPQQQDEEQDEEPGRFGPVAGDGEGSLELAEQQPARRPPGPSAPSGSQTIYRPSAGPDLSWLRWAVGLAVIAGVALVLWQHRTSIQSAVTSTPAEPETVLLLVETEPRSADVFVDGVLAVTRPIQLPRTDGTYVVRVQARGYHAAEREVTGARTRVVRVRLKRRRRR